MIAKQRFYLFIVGSLVLVYVAIQAYCINQLSPSYDEGSFAAYGATILKFQRQKDIVAFESKLPITALNMIPRAIEQLFRPRLTKSWPEAQADIFHGRYVSLLFAVLLGLLILFWTKQLYNDRTALFVFLCYLVCPNFLAHGIFVSSDIFACFFMTAAFYCLWYYFQRRQFRYYLFMCIATGCAEISKFSMFHLLLLIPCLIILQAFYKRSLNPSNGIGLKRVVSYIILFFVVNWFIICAAHLFYQVFIPINGYTFKSYGFRAVQAFFNHTVPQFPVPLPSSYINSMDAVMYFDNLGGGVPGSLNGSPYLLGEHSIKGFWYYYLVVVFYKLPLSLLIFWSSSMLLLVITFSRKRFFEDDIFLVLPILYFLIYMSFFYSTQVGIRHLLIIFPLFFVFSGRAVYWLFSEKKPWILALFMAYQALSAFSYFPHFLPYTNEFIPNKKMAYKKIADTNLCYGEGKKFLMEYLAKHREVIYMPDKPVAGRVAFEVNEMLNLNIATVHRYDWAASLTPIDHIHSQYLVFDITQQQVDSIQKQHKL